MRWADAPLNSPLVSRLLSVGGFAALYVALYRVSELISGNGAFEGVASVFFLPAFVRLLAFMMIGFWSIPALFIAAMICIDLAIGLGDRVVLSAFLAAGAPLGIAAVCRLVRLDVSLANLTPIMLLWLSLGSALGNAVLYHAGLVLIGFGHQSDLSQLVIFIGDATGTWAVIYLIKLGLTILGRSFPR